MLRILSIIILLAVALATGGWGWHAHKEHQMGQQTPKEGKVYDFQLASVSEILAEAPGDGEAIELEKFHFPQEAIGVDLDGQPGWEEAYLPLFPNDVVLKGHNLVSVIYKTNTLKNSDDVEAFFKNETLKGFYVQSKQKLSKVAFGKLAKRYGSMDYDRSVLITSELPEEQLEIQTYWFALAAFAGLLLMAGWQSLGLVGDIRSRIQRGNEIENGPVGHESVFGDE